MTRFRFCCGNPLRMCRKLFRKEPPPKKAAPETKSNVSLLDGTTLKLHIGTTTAQTRGRADGRTEGRPQAKIETTSCRKTRTHSELAKAVLMISNLSNYRTLHNIWAPDFEADMIALGYRGPEIVARLIKNAPKVRSDSKILDLFCGSGLLGVALQKRGFTHVIGVDVAEQMVQIAENKQCYKVCRTLDVCQLLNQRYDVVVTCSAFQNSLMKLKATPNLVTLLATDSLLVVAQPLPTESPEAIEVGRFTKYIVTEFDLRLVQVVTVREFVHMAMGVIGVFSSSNKLNVSNVL